MYQRYIEKDFFFVMRILISDPNFCGPCTIEIAAYAVTESMFSIRASTETSIIMLRNGIPETLDLTAGEYIYSKITVDR